MQSIEINSVKVFTNPEMTALLASFAKAMK